MTFFVLFNERSWLFTSLFFCAPPELLVGWDQVSERGLLHPLWEEMTRCFVKSSQKILNIIIIIIIYLSQVKSTRLVIVVHRIFINIFCLKTFIYFRFFWRDDFMMMLIMINYIFSFFFLEESQVFDVTGWSKQYFVIINCCVPVCDKGLYLYLIVSVVYLLIVIWRSTKMFLYCSVDFI